MAIDVFSLMLSLFGVRTQGVPFLGRWLAYITQGKFYHQTIMQTPSVAIVGMPAK